MAEHAGHLVVPPGIRCAGQESSLVILVEQAADDSGLLLL
jgi:hypothetical protein